MAGEHEHGRKQPEGRPLRAGERLSRSSGSPAPPRPPGRSQRPGAVRKVFGSLLGFALVLGVVGLVVAWQGYEHYAAGLPTLDTLKHYDPKVVTRLYADNSQLLAEYATERRIFVPVSAIPKQVQQAFISAEDRTFWTHHGIDPAAIVRAGLHDLAQWGKGRRPQGASTITQQLAKNMLVGNQLSLTRKIKEAILAIRIDQSLSKQRVLELYLNEIYLGMGSYGVAAAAQTYFNKSLDQLTLAEAAFLGGLPKAPNTYNPFRNPDAARARRDFVLARMREDGAITAAQEKQAAAQPITAAPYREPDTVPDGKWFAEEVRRLLVGRYGAERVNTGGLTVRTSLDPALQRDADRALQAGLLAYDRKRGGWRGPVTHLPAGPELATDWATQLAAVHAPGLLPSWRLGIVLSVTPNQANVGWLEPLPGQPPAQGAPHTAPILLSDLGWARPVHHGVLGPVPRRVGDVLQAGDVVMVEPEATQGHGRPGVPGERLALRQVPQAEAAIVAMDPATGRVLAMSGGWSFDLSQFNRATQAQRQPGSSFKPYVYLTALEDGYAPSQRVLDAPFVLNTPSGQWRPNNFELNFHGPTPIRIALEQSLNLVTVRLAQKLGMNAVAKTAEAFHVVDHMPKYLPAALGAVETTVLRQAAGYAGFAEGGRAVLPSFVDTVQDQHGNVIYTAPGLTCSCGDPNQPPALTDDRKQIADPQSVFQLVTMMEGVVKHGTGYPVAGKLGRAIAGKTGTSQDFNDAWFVGFTPDLVTAVWVGKDDNTSLGNNETGADAAGPIWRAFMQKALQNRPNLKFLVPPGLTLAQWDSGYGPRTDAFKPDQVPGSSQGTIGGGDSGMPGDAGLTADSSSASQGSGVGVDSGMGGLY